ncbi:MAG TPA: helix-turn-helix transcriptional regulator [Rubrobacteraceae bacterium]|nr:helix-turn-helix transcriptional regulator [Rubrobacteraceae bacterium]
MLEGIDPVALARNLIRTRKATGLTQVQLAEKADKSASTVSTLESGKVARPHFGTILDLADALGVAPEDLVGEGSVPKDEASRPEENGQRRTYPYPWMGEAFGDLLSAWAKVVEQGYSPEHCRVIAAGAYDALDAVVPPLASARAALPKDEKRERQQFGRELSQLAHDAYAVYEQSAEAEPAVLESIEARREEMKRRTKEIA